MGHKGFNRRSLKKYRLLINVIVLAIIGGIGLSLTRKQEVDVLADVASEDIAHPYVETKYFDFSHSSKPTLSRSRPFELRHVSITHVPLEDISHTIHRDLSAEGGWRFLPESKGIPVNAVEGILKKGPPDEQIMVQAVPSEGGGFSAVVHVDSYDVIELRPLTPWQVWWLKFTHLGHDPFAHSSS